MRKLLLVFALLALAAITPVAQTPLKPNAPTADAEQAVKALTLAWLDAESRHDRKILQGIIAEDFLGTGPKGNTVSREDLLPEEGATTGGLAVTGQSILARIFGETAVVTGHGIPRSGGPTDLRFTIVFVKRGEKWQMVAGHLSMAPGP